MSMKYGRVRNTVEIHMTKYITQERARYWPVPLELMAQYNDGSHAEKNNFDSLIWKQNDLWHRDDDKPAYISTDGSLAWFQNDERYRDGDKPAVISTDGCLAWWQNGKRHRFRGPAIIHLDGRLEWWINHKNTTDEVNAWLAGEEWCGTPLQIFEFQLRFV